MFILLLRLIIFASITLWSFLTRLIFFTMASLLVMLIHVFKVPSDAAHGGFQQISGAIRSCFELFFKLIMKAMNFLVTKLFDLVKQSMTGSVGYTESVIGDLAEKMKTSFDEALKSLAESSKEISDLVTKVVQELWNNYKDAVGYVKENIA